MTLVVGVIGKDLICAATDARFTAANGNFSDNNSKSLKITTNDADLMISFTGRADFPMKESKLTTTTVNWLADYVSNIKPNTKTSEELVKELTQELNTVLFTPYPEESRDLILLVLGRSRTAPHRPVAYTVSNLENGTFENNSVSLASRPRKIIIDGWMPATESHLFQSKQNEIKQLLAKRNHSQFEKIIRDKCLELIQIAASDNKSEGMIGGRAVGSILNLDGTLSVRHVPDNGVRVFPGFQNEFMTVTDIKITGNPPGEGADYKIGG